MYAEQQITEYLKPVGRNLAINFKNEIHTLAGHVEEDEIVENVGFACRGLMGISLYIVVATSKRILTTMKNNRNIVSYEWSMIENPKFKENFISRDLIFNYNGLEIIMTFQTEIALKFIEHLEEILYNDDIRPKSVNRLTGDQRKVIRFTNPNSFNISIINGREQLKDMGNVFKLTQIKPGEIEIKVDYQNTPETFKLINWERIENIQKSALNIASWTVIGSAFGGTGALAGAMGANVGKDKSIATLFLKRFNGEKIALVIKCDKKDFEKLSLLIVAEEEETTQAAVTPPPTTSIPTEELIKLKELLDLGILTQEEFDAKKKQLLGI